MIIDSDYSPRQLGVELPPFDHMFIMIHMCWQFGSEISNYYSQREGGVTFDVPC